MDLETPFDFLQTMVECRILGHPEIFYEQLREDAEDKLQTSEQYFNNNVSYVSFASWAVWSTRSGYAKSFSELANLSHINEIRLEYVRKLGILCTSP